MWPTGGSLVNELLLASPWAGSSSFAALVLPKSIEKELPLNNELGRGNSHQTW